MNDGHPPDVVDAYIDSWLAHMSYVLDNIDASNTAPTPSFQPQYHASVNDS